MVCAGFLSFVVLSLASLPACLADVTLTVPGYYGPEPPLSVDIIGVGSDGETTYLLAPGQPTTTWVGQEPALPGTMTLIEGANNAVIEYGDPEFSMTMVESCTLANGMGDCIVVLPGQTTIVDEVPAMPMLVQGGGTASPAPTSVAIPAVPAQMTPVPGSSVPGSAAATQSAASPSITPSKSASSGVRLTPVKVVGLGLAGMLAIWAVLA